MAANHMGAILPPPPPGAIPINQYDHRRPQGVPIMDRFGFDDPNGDPYIGIVDQRPIKPAKLKVAPPWFEGYVLRKAPATTTEGKRSWWRILREDMHNSQTELEQLCKDHEKKTRRKPLKELDLLENSQRSQINQILREVSQSEQQSAMSGEWNIAMIKQDMRRQGLFQADAVVALHVILKRLEHGSSDGKDKVKEKEKDKDRMADKDMKPRGPGKLVDLSEPMSTKANKDKPKDKIKNKVVPMDLDDDWPDYNPHTEFQQKHPGVVHHPGQGGHLVPVFPQQPMQGYKDDLNHQFSNTLAMGPPLPFPPPNAHQMPYPPDLPPPFYQLEPQQHPQKHPQQQTNHHSQDAYDRFDPMGPMSDPFGPIPHRPRPTHGDGRIVDDRNPFDPIDMYHPAEYRPFDEPMGRNPHMPQPYPGPGPHHVLPERKPSFRNLARRASSPGPLPLPRRSRSFSMKPGEKINRWNEHHDHFPFESSDSYDSYCSSDASTNITTPYSSLAAGYRGRDKDHYGDHHAHDHKHKHHHHRDNSHHHRDDSSQYHHNNRDRDMGAHKHHNRDSGYYEPLHHSRGNSGHHPLQLQGQHGHTHRRHVSRANSYGSGGNEGYCRDCR